MRYLLCFTLLFASLAYADTVAQRVAELEAAPGVGAGNVYADTANAADVPNFTCGGCDSNPRRPQSSQSSA